MFDSFFFFFFFFFFFDTVNDKLRMLHIMKTSAPPQPWWCAFEQGGLGGWGDVSSQGLLASVLKPSAAHCCTHGWWLPSTPIHYPQPPSSFSTGGGGGGGESSPSPPKLWFKKRLNRNLMYFYGCLAFSICGWASLRNSAQSRQAWWCILMITKWPHTPLPKNTPNLPSYSLHTQMCTYL